MREIVERFLRAAKEKNTDCLDGIFTEDAVYIERTGTTYNGLAQIRARLGQMTSDGDVRAWDIRRVIDSRETGAVEWYYEYQKNGAGTVSYDGVSVIEISDGKIKRWSEYAQTVNKTYPYQDGANTAKSSPGLFRRRPLSKSGKRWKWGRQHD